MKSVNESSMVIEPKVEKLLELGPKDMAWICEVCSHPNRLRIDK